eukprot:6498915-Prymnesium_polylepis.1
MHIWERTRRGVAAGSCSGQGTGERPRKWPATIAEVPSRAAAPLRRAHLGAVDQEERDERSRRSQHFATLAKRAWSCFGSRSKYGSKFLCGTRPHRPLLSDSSAKNGNGLVVSFR